MGKTPIARLSLAAVAMAGVAAGLGYLVSRVDPPSDASSSPQATTYAGSVSCRECHADFYQLWAPSHHGLAMQPYTTEFADNELTPQNEPIAVGAYTYRAVFEGNKGTDQDAARTADAAAAAGYVIEQGPDGQRRYPIEHVLGGKNVYYFLTPMDRGRLQTLPVAYDVRRRQWFDTSASGIRHIADEPVRWTDAAYTFNTACYRCHVSQLSTNYDAPTDTYHTTWAEPGINCETCHGPGAEHVRVCREASQGHVPEDLKLVRGGRDFTADQNNAACGSCHAKMIPLNTTFEPGDAFFDHFDLVALEDPDFYPDGRDLGENYTQTLWRMSPCAQSGQLDCLHCHTSSGRFRQKDDPNQACMPCHQQRVENAAAHTHHEAGKPGNQCIACHMPTTEFARMGRTDHSMRPPTPAATLAWGSPNACNLCHTDDGQDAAWADAQVRKWHADDYQAPVLHRAELLDAARKSDFRRLPEMLALIEPPDRDEILATSLVRLLRACDRPAVWPAILDALDDPSPLVRSSAATSLDAVPPALADQAVASLVKACGDESRLVRVRAAAALANYPGQTQPPAFDARTRRLIDRATEELLASYLARPDHWSSHYNLGNYHLAAGDLFDALAAYRMAQQLEPRAVMPLVNSSIIFAQLGQNREAEQALRKALAIEPNSAPVHFNLGLLAAEQNDPTTAETHLRAAWRLDPKMHEASYNLAILVGARQPAEAIDLCQQAFQLSPSPRYGYMQAYFQWRSNQPAQAASLLRQVLAQWPDHQEARELLDEINRAGK